MASERPIEPGQPAVEAGPRWETIVEVEEKRTHLSWGAVFAGSVVAVALSVLLNLIGLGAGAIAVSPGEGGDMGVGIGTAVWTVIAGVIALGFGGWVTGRLSGSPRRVEGVLHGLITWGVATLTTLWLLTSAAGSLLGGAVGLVGQALPTATEQLQQRDLQGPQEQLQQPGVQERASEIAQQVSNIAGGVALAAAIAMILGAVAAALGGMIAVQRRKRELRAASPLH